MKKSVVLAAGVFFFLVCSDPSQAKEKKKEKEQQDKPAAAKIIDAAQCTCTDVLKEKDKRVIAVGAIWVDGYLSGKTGETRIDLNDLNSLADRVKAYCEKNPTAPILDAVKISSKIEH
jgi:acid stress chaperone HdeB